MKHKKIKIGNYYKLKSGPYAPTSINISNKETREVIATLHRPLFEVMRRTARYAYTLRWVQCDSEVRWTQKDIEKLLEQTPKLKVALLYET